MRLSIKTAFLGLFAALALGGCSCPPHTIKVSPAGSGLEGLRVSGQGQSRGTPDIARATLGVEVRAQTSEEANQQVAQRMQAVLAALKAQGVAERDLRTEQISVFFEQEIRPPEPWPGPQTTPGKGTPEKTPEAPAPVVPKGFYRATNTVEVTLRDLDRASAVLGAATAAGANSMYGLRFELENDAKVLAEAREKAVKQARANAEELARLSGVKLGPVVSINENRGFAGPMPMMMKAESSPAQDASVPVERGELTVSTQVEIVYSLTE